MITHFLFLFLNYFWIGKLKFILKLLIFNKNFIYVIVVFYLLTFIYGFFLVIKDLSRVKEKSKTLKFELFRKEGKIYYPHDLFWDIYVIFSEKYINRQNLKCILIFTILFPLLQFFILISFFVGILYLYYHCVKIFYGFMWNIDLEINFRKEEKPKNLINLYLDLIKKKAFSVIYAGLKKKENKKDYYLSAIKRIFIGKVYGESLFIIKLWGEFFLIIKKTLTQKNKKKKLLFLPYIFLMKMSVIISYEIEENWETYSSYTDFKVIELKNRKLRLNPSEIRGLIHLKDPRFQEKTIIKCIKFFYGKLKEDSGVSDLLSKEMGYKKIHVGGKDHLGEIIEKTEDIKLVKVYTSNKNINLKNENFIMQYGAFEEPRVSGKKQYYTYAMVNQDRVQGNYNKKLLNMVHGENENKPELLLILTRFKAIIYLSDKNSQLVDHSKNDFASSTKTSGELWRDLNLYGNPLIHMGLLTFLHKELAAKVNTFVEEQKNKTFSLEEIHEAKMEMEKDIKLKIDYLGLTEFVSMCESAIGKDGFEEFRAKIMDLKKESKDEIDH